jgi:autotransporter-associated beta strand protein
VYNVTIYKSGSDGFHRSTPYGTANLYNCYSGGNTGLSYNDASLGWNTFIKCASSDVSGSESGLRSIAASTTSGAYFTNLTGGSEDLHIASASALKDAGNNYASIWSTWLGTTGVNIVDIDDSPRSGTWDIGADEFVTLQWTGGTSSDWAVGSNWSSGSAPATGQDVTLTGAGANPTNQSIGSLSLSSLTFDGTTTSAFTVAGSPITLTGAGALVVASGAGNHILSTNIVLGSDQTWFQNSAGTFTVSGGVISGAHALTKQGSGTLVLSGSNTYSGLTTIGAGTLRLGANGGPINYPLGTSAAGTVVSSGGALDLNGFTTAPAEVLTLNGTGVSGSGALYNSSASSSTFPGLITLGSASSIVATNGNILISNAGTIGGNTFGLTLDGAAAGSSITSIIGTTTGTVTKTGSGTWTLAGVNTYTGATTVNAGTLLLAATGSTAAGSAVTVNGGTIGGTGIINGTLTVNTLGTLSPGVTTASGTLTVGNNNITLAPGAVFNVHINGNNNNDMISWGGAGTCNLNSATLALTILTTAPVVGNTYKIIDATSTGGYGGSTFNGLAEGAKTSGTYGGTTYYFTISYASAGDVVLTCAAAPTAWTGGAGAPNVNWSLGGNWTPAAAPGNNALIAFNGSSSGQLTTGSENLALTGISISFTNPTGDVTIATGGQTMGLGAGGIDMSNASKNFTINTALALNAAQPWTVASGYTLTAGAPITNGANLLTITGPGSTIINGALTGGTAGGITKNGSGTLTIGGNNTYTGATTINAGTVKLGATGTSPNGPLGTVGTGTTVSATGAALDLAGYTLATAEPLTINGTGVSSGGALTNSGVAATWSGLIALGSNASIISNNGNILVSNAGTISGAGFGFTLDGTAAGSSIASIIGTGAGTVTKNGSGTWTLSGVSSYTGLTAINAGTLKLGAAGNGTNSPLGTVGSGTIVSATGAALDLNGINLSTAEPLTLNGTGVSNGGALTNSSATSATFLGLLTLGSSSSIVANSGNIVISSGGTITGLDLGLTLDGTNAASSMASIIGTGNNGTLTKNGSGTWTLSGYSTYGGTTTINAGTLKASTYSDLSGGPIGKNSPVVFANVASAVLDVSSAYTNNVGSLSGGGSTGGNVLMGTVPLSIGGDNSTPAVAYGGIISGSGTLHKVGTGTINFSGNNTTTGLISIEAGTLQLGAAGNGTNTPLGTTAAGTTVTATGAALDLNGITLSTAEALTLNGTGVSGGGALLNSSATAATYSGLISLGSASSIVGTNGDIIISNAGTISNAYGLTLDGTTAGSSIASIIGTGANTVTKTGTGTWTLSGVNTFTGGLAILSGTIIATTSSQAVGNGGNITLGNASGNASASLLVGTNGLTINRPVILATNPNVGTLTIGTSGTTGIITLAMGVTGNNDLNISPGGTGGITVSVLLNNVGAIINSGAGTGTITASGTVIGSNVTAIIQNSTTSTFTINGTVTIGPTLTLANYSGTKLLNLSGGMSSATTGNLILSNNSSTDNGVEVTNNAKTVNNAGTITNSGTGTGAALISAVIGTNVTGVIQNSATSTLTLSAANTYTGPTTISSGTLSVATLVNGGVSSNIGNAASAVVLGDASHNGILSYTGAADTYIRGFTVNAGGGELDNTTANLLQLSTAGVATSGTFTLCNTSSGGITVNNTSVISGIGGVAVNNSGTGVVTLAATNTYTGATTVNAGTLSLTGSAAAGSAVTVNNGGTLAGTGTVNGTLAVNAGGTLGPGVGAASGTLTAKNNITLASGAVFNATLNGNANNDMISWSGTGTCNLNSATLALTIGTTAPVVGNTYKIIDNTSTGTISGTFNGLAQGAMTSAVYTTTTYYFTISYTGGTGNDVVLTCVAAPNSWKGATSALWSVGTNWTTAAPTNGTTIAYNSNSTTNLGAGNNDITVPSTLTGMSIYFSNPSGAVTIANSQVLGLGAGGIDMTSATQNFTINTGLTLGAAQTWNVASGRTLTAGSTVTNGANLLTIDGAGNATIGGVVGAGSGGLTKNGTGTLTLSNTNTYTGATIVNAGTLSVTGQTNVNSNVTIMGGGTLIGTGTINGSVDASASGATITPGVGSAAPLYISKANGTALTLGTGSILNFDIGTTSDQIVCNGAASNITIGGTLNIAASGSFAGTKTIMTCLGSVTDLGLGVGTITGAPGYHASISTATAHQVNLIITLEVTPVWSVTGLGIVNGGAITENVIYAGTHTPDNLYCRSLTDGSNKWTYNTGAYGGCGMPTYSYIGSSYYVLASAGNYVIGQQDNGTSSSQMFAPQNLGATAGTPYISPDNANFFVTYAGHLSKRSLATGASVIDVAVTNISTSADIVVYSDYVYVATTDGKVNKGDATDFTPLSTFSIGGGSPPSINLPLVVSGATLYATPNNGTLYAIPTSTMTTANWTLNYSQGGSNTGAAFATGSNIYTAVGNYVYKITDNGGSGTENWHYNASAQVSSGPICYSSTVYFGRNIGYCFALNDANGSIVSAWPYTAATGNATTGPWIDRTNSRVLFGTTGGDLRAFTLGP